MPILADIATAPAFTHGSPLLALAVFALPILIETFIFTRLGWESLQQALRDALLVNLASTLAGFVYFGVATAAAFKCGRIPASDGEHFATSCGWTIPIAVILVIAWALSIVIEGSLLAFVLRRGERRAMWRAALLANIASYVLLAPLFLALLAPV